MCVHNSAQTHPLKAHSRSHKSTKSKFDLSLITAPGLLLEQKGAQINFVFSFFGSRLQLISLSTTTTPTTYFYTMKTVTENFINIIAVQMRRRGESTYHMEQPKL